MTFEKGQSGNPAGRPRGALGKITKYMDELCNSEGLPNHYEAVRSRLK